MGVRGAMGVGFPSGSAIGVKVDRRQASRHPQGVRRQRLASGLKPNYGTPIGGKKSVCFGYLWGSHNSRGRLQNRTPRNSVSESFWGFLKLNGLTVLETAFLGRICLPLLIWVFLLLLAMLPAIRFQILLLGGVTSPDC